MEFRQRRAPESRTASLATNEEFKTGMTASSFQATSLATPVIFQQSNFDQTGHGTDLLPSGSLTRQDSYSRGTILSSSLKTARKPPVTSLLDDIGSPLLVRESQPTKETQSIPHNHHFEATTQSAVQYATPSDNLYKTDTYLYSWIVISGFQQSAQSMQHQILQRFQRYGEIVGYRMGHGNWIFVRFSSVVEADQAVHNEHNSLLDGSSHCLLNVTKLTSALANKLQFDMSTETSSSTSRQSDLGRAYRQPFNVSDPSSSDYQQCYQPPKSRQMNICKRLTEFFYSY